MKLLKKTIIAVATSVSLSGGLLYADTPAYVNPFINSSQPAATAPQTTPNSANMAPQTLPSSTNAANQTTQPSQPNYDFSKKPTGLIGLQPIAIPNSSGNSSRTTTPTVSASAPLPPSLGPGGTQQDAGQSLIQAVDTLDMDVKNTNALSIAQWNQRIQNESAANAMLLPTTLNFLWGQTAYQNIQQLMPSAINQQTLLQNALASTQNTCTGQGGNSNSQNCNSSSNISPLQLMTPQAVNSNVVAAAAQLTAAGQSISSMTNTDSSYQDALLGPVQATAANDSSQVTQLPILATAQYALANLSTSNQMDVSDNIDSQMNILNTAVTMPLSNTPDPTSGQTWFQQLSVASTPQLLRTVAIMLALNNYLQYQNLKASQNQQLLQAAQLVEEVRVEQAVDAANQAAERRQTNGMLQLKTMLQNLRR